MTKFLKALFWFLLPFLGQLLNHTEHVTIMTHIKANRFFEAILRGSGYDSKYQILAKWRETHFEAPPISSVPCICNERMTNNKSQGQILYFSIRNIFRQTSLFLWPNICDVIASKKPGNIKLFIKPYSFQRQIIGQNDRTFSKKRVIWNQTPRHFWLANS